MSFMISLSRTASADGSGNGSDAKYSYHPSFQRLLRAVEMQSVDDLLAALQAGVKVNHNDEGSFSETSLHKAVKNCWGDGVRTLLSHGAKVLTRNQFGQTPLHYAAGARSVECTRLLLQHEGGQSRGTGGAGELTAAVDYKDRRGRTPLHDAAEKASVDIIKLLLKAGAKVDVTDDELETPLHKAAKSCSAPAAMLALLNGGANLTQRVQTGESVLSYSLRHNPRDMEALFDSCLVTNTGNFTAKSLEVKFNFVPCLCSSDNNQMRCLWNIVEYGHAKLLKHPLCETFLLMKWFKVKKFFFIQFVYYFLYAILTTLLTFDKFLEKSCDQNTTVVIDPDSENIFPHPVKLTFLSIVLAQAILILFSFVLSLIYTFSSTKFNLWNALHVILSLLVFLVLPLNTIDTRYWQQHLAAIMLLLLWTQCMLLVGRIPACGIYVVMFKEVAGVFVRIFAVYFSLLLAFSFSFHIMEHVEGSHCGTIPEVFLTFLKTLSMMIGELDFTEAFRLQLQYLPFTSHIIFLLFVILVAIILSNLLVALAVNDVQSLRNSAHLERLIKQMELVFEMEQSFNGMAYLMEHLCLSRFTVYPKNAIHYDPKTTSVSMKPYDPQESNSLCVAFNPHRLRDSQYLHDTHDLRHLQRCRVAVRLTSSVLDRLRLKMDVFPHDRKPSMKHGRLKRPRSTEYNNNDDLKDCFKQLETNLSDLLCDRLDQVMTCNASLSARITALENEVRTLRRSQSQASYVTTSPSSQHRAVQRLRTQLPSPSASSSASLQRPLSHQQLATTVMQKANVDVRECKSLDPRRQEEQFVLQRADSSGQRSASGDVFPAENDV